MRRRRLAVFAAWCGVFSAVAFAATVVVGGAQARPGTCSRPDGVRLGDRRGEALMLQIPDDARVVLRFGDGRTRQIYPISLRVPEGQRLVRADFRGDQALSVMTGDTSIRKDVDHWISLNPNDGLNAMLIPVSDTRVELCVVVDPERIGGLVPGRYDGTIFVARGAGGSALAAIPVEFTFRASRWTAIGIAFSAVALGLLVKIFSEAGVRQRDANTNAKTALKDYCCELTFPSALILAMVAGVLVFDQMYNGNAMWGAGNGDIAKLFAVCFIAQMSGNQGIDIVKRIAGGSTAAPAAIASR